MTDEQVKQFSDKWKHGGDENAQTQLFWIEFLTDVLGIERPTDFIEFEKTVSTPDGSSKKIDCYIKSARLLIEQKSSNVDMGKRHSQSDGETMTAFEQAKRYNDNLPYDEKAMWIITCNFTEFNIYDMNSNKPWENYETIKTPELSRKRHRFQFIAEPLKKRTEYIVEQELSVSAGNIVGKLYDSFYDEFARVRQTDRLDAIDLHSINKLCVRIVFCLYAEDSGVFAKNQFHDYMNEYRPEQMGGALSKLFNVLDTPYEKRDPFCESALSAFPYVNGSLFKIKEDEHIPPFTKEMARILLEEASLGFDWSPISPTIFGAVFESTLNPETRRKGGMHYTSIENIHKVIDPLFMDSLKKELAGLNVGNRQKIEEFHERLASLTFLDPASGCGNFLTESYISLRRLENEAISLITRGQSFLGIKEINPIKVSIGQFYGIEINDFACSVAQTALWIAENQMKKETEQIIRFSLDYLPLKSYSNIVEGNSLRIDWDSLHNGKFDYIIGNPPFSGGKKMSQTQKEDMKFVFGENWKNLGTMDYVCCWYKKSADYMTGTDSETALVSTNSITQGEAVESLLGVLLNDGIFINYAYRTFRWDSESNIPAHVHCVIISFSHKERECKFIMDGENRHNVDYINGYLIGYKNLSIGRRTVPLCSSPKFKIGNKPIDDKNYLFTRDEMEEFIKTEPDSKDYFHPFWGAEDFINNIPRFCLWLGDCNPETLRKMPHCLKRVENVRKFRLQSTDAGTRRLGNSPTRFHVESFPDRNYLFIPRHSSESRIYIPIGFLKKNDFSGDSALISEDADIYDFGILTSSVHMAWMRAVCGRIKSDPRYSKDVVYNNFPWPTPADEQRLEIERTAQGILDARSLYPDCSLADLYNETTMPIELRKAHQANDKAVMNAYGFTDGMAENEILKELFRMYEELVKTNEKNIANKKRTSKK